MADREHTSTHYEHQLRELKDKLLLLSHKAELMISDSIRSLAERRPVLAEDVISRDDEIDQLEIAIDYLCYEILALEQPVAVDLRFIGTVMKIVKDIERIGDIAVNIAERALELIQEPELKRLVDMLMMADAAKKILKEGLDAFVNSDAELAEKVIFNDNVLDDLYEQIFRELLTYMLEDPRSISRAIKLIFVAKALERVGDHSTNIAEMVVFLVRGHDIRHRMGPDRRQ
jgi:phosphate transport system protein